MPTFTFPADDSLTEVNHCHGAGKGHPCGEGGDTVPCGPQGECFRNTSQFVRDHEADGYKAVHGKVTNAQGETLDHAWAENDTHVVDPTQGVKLPKREWRAATQAQPEAAYTAEQLALNQLRTGHHGPWSKTDRAVADWHKAPRTHPKARAAGMRRDK